MVEQKPIEHCQHHTIFTIISNYRLSSNALRNESAGDCSTSPLILLFSRQFSKPLRLFFKMQPVCFYNEQHECIWHHIVGSLLGQLGDNVHLMCPLCNGPRQLANMTCDLVNIAVEFCRRSVKSDIVEEGMENHFQLSDFGMEDRIGQSALCVSCWCGRFWITEFRNYTKHDESGMYVV